MASNAPIPNNPDAELRSRKKRRKIEVEDLPEISPIDHTRWRNATEQQIYSSKLVQALRNRRRGGGGAVRDTADEVLAVTAKGKTRWSRAILTSRLSMRMNRINRKHKRAKAAKISRDSKCGILEKRKKKKVPLLMQKVQVLGSLVPGCRKVSFPNLLDETTDYIEALEMQVRAMTFITQLLNRTGAGLTDLPVHASGPVHPGT